MGRRKGGVPLLKDNEVIMHRFRNPTFSIHPWGEGGPNGIRILFRDHGGQPNIYLTKMEARILMRRLMAIFDRHDFGGEGSDEGIRMPGSDHG